MTPLADRGLGTSVLHTTLDWLGWDEVIRFRGCILVVSKGIQQPGSDRLSLAGRVIMFAGATVTGERAEVCAVVAIKTKGMKDPCCLVTFLCESAKSVTIKLYG